MQMQGRFRPSAHSLRRHALRAGLCACLLAPWAARGADGDEYPFAAMSSLASWQLGGQRVAYSLGRSSLAVSREVLSPGGEPTLALAYDFADARRHTVSAYWTGAAMPGVCRGLSFALYGDASGCPLQLTVEDADGNWFQRRVGVVDWEGWRRLEASLGEGADWTAVLVWGQERRPPRHPVSLRQIALLRYPGAPALGTIYLADLRVTAEVTAIDRVETSLAADRSPALYDVGERVVLTASLVHRGATPLTGDLAWVVRDAFGKEEALGNAAVRLAPGDTVRASRSLTAARTGPYEVDVHLRAEAGTRRWRCRFAVTRPGPAPGPDQDAVFGCCGAIQGFTPGQIPTVLRLDRDAGIRWVRMGFPWSAMEPLRGQYAWLPARTAPGVSGQALEGQGGNSTLSVPPNPLLDVRDAFTLAFWLRCAGANERWQCPVTRGLAPHGRTYSVYLGRENGLLSFSGGFEELPDAPHTDVNSDWCAWDNRWHHVAVTYAATEGTMRFYADGTLQCERTVAGGALRADGSGLDFAHCFPGAVDEVVLCRRCLPAESVASLARGADPPPDGLAGWWRFDDPADPGRDSGPHGLHAVSATPPIVRSVQIAREHGLRTLGILGFPPRWASTAPPEAERPQVYAPDLQAWGEYVEAITRQYRGLVDHWEIWNEPNISVFWLPEPDPVAFFAVVKAGYAAAKRGNPGCTVITPGLAGPHHGGDEASAYLEALIRLGLPRHCDAISVHPYRHRLTPEASDLAGNLRRIADLTSQHGGPSRLWITELCWATHLSGGTTEWRAAQMLGRAVPLALHTGLLDRIIWFRLHDPGLDRFYLEHNCALCRNNLLPKPEYFAYRTCATLLDGAEPDGEAGLVPPLFARCFQRGEEHLAALWSTEGDHMAALDVGAPEATVVDLMGNESQRRTREGILLEVLGEDVLFLRGLPRRPLAAEAPLRAEAPSRVRIGGPATIMVRLANPFATEAAFRVEMDASDALVPNSTVPAPTLPGRGRTQLPITVSVPADARPGWRTIPLRASLGERTWVHLLRLGVTGVDPAAGPLARWSMDGTEADRIPDGSGHGHHGTCADVARGPGRYGTALLCDGRTFGRVPHAPDLDLAEEVTLACWVRMPAATGTWQSLVTKFLGDRIRNYGLYVRPDGSGPGFSASFENASTPHTDTVGAFPLADDRWHHVAATASVLDRMVRLYVDGLPVAERALDLGLMKPNAEPVLLGQDLHGALDEVQIHGRALGPAEIAALARP
ncbi:MAG: hypothetical protein JXR77_18845 [Lentisphaeria bacterium]|nr:hypothetical protein [Lentisphaeria bacterium]